MVEHLKKGDAFQCIFQGCNVKFLYIPQFRTHLSRYHRESNVVETLSQSGINETECESSALDEEICAFDDVSNASVSEEDTDLYPDFLIKIELAKFYLKLESEYILPTCNVQAVADELKIITELSHYRLQKALFEELKKTNLEKDVIASIVKQTFKHDTVFNVHHKHEDVEQLGTHHSRLQFWQKMFPFVVPQEINLGLSDTGTKRRAHYISIRKSLEILLKDPLVKKAVLKSFDLKGSEDPQILSDYTDGSAYRDHCKLHDGPCLQLLGFQDAFEFNPFGPSSGVYKPVGFYYSLGNIPAVYRSKVDLIQMVYMILEKDFKCSEEEEMNDVDKMKQALKPFLDELEELKINGIDIDGKNVPVCLLFLLGDSLGQNTIGGYVKNFSSAQFSCRFCPMSVDQFKETPHETKPLRTPNQYDKYCAIAKKKKWLQVRKEGIKARKKAREQAKKNAQKIANRSSAPSKRDLKGLMSKSAYKKLLAVSYRGVKYRPSALNSPKTKFHVVGAQPPCLAHDLFEGIVKSVLTSILKYFIEDKQWFDLPCLNRRIKSFKCKGSDARDAPAPMKSLEKLGGNACENWNLLRLLPFMISDLIQDRHDPMWQLYLLLKQVCEFVCAPRITLHQISYLQFQIELYLSKIKDLLPSSLFPKQHYLGHYPGLILMFGPLIRLFTLRFESKHSFFKKVVRACKNYTNITHTMANKYACRFAYDHGSLSLLPLDIIYNSNFSVGLNPDLFSDNIKSAFPSNFDSADAEELRDVVINGINYNKEFYFVLGSEGTNLRVACIERIFLQRSSNTVQFLIQEKLAENSFDGYYIIQKNSVGFKLTTLSALPDYYALPTYQFDGNECLSLKHTTVTME